MDEYSKTSWVDAGSLKYGLDRSFCYPKSLLSGIGVVGSISKFLNEDNIGNCVLFSSAMNFNLFLSRLPSSQRYVWEHRMRS